MDWDGLGRSVEIATRFLDDVVDANAYVPAVPQLKEAALRARRIGLGHHGSGRHHVPCRRALWLTRGTGVWGAGDGIRPLPCCAYQRGAGTRARGVPGHQGQHLRL